MSHADLVAMARHNMAHLRAGTIEQAPEIGRVPVMVLVDGNRLPRWPYRSQPVVGGDGRVPAIAAASILAKVQRDAEMVAMDAAFPGYGLARHKGYPTREHLDALRRLGVTPMHRRSFGPVRDLVEPD